MMKAKGRTDRVALSTERRAAEGQMRLANLFNVTDEHSCRMRSLIESSRMGQASTAGTESKENIDARRVVIKKTGGHRRVKSVDKTKDITALYSKFK